ncbi:MAG: transketolase [Planctomycetota bacterium]
MVKLGADTVRLLSADAVQKANSGHPGMPMGAADYAFLLWAKHLKFNPADPEWPNRDRFILSAGHGSMLIYSLLHLFGYKVPMSQLKQFRQFGSITPGHPEYGETPGVETTTGPLGQGFANGVGMALAEKMAQARFNTSAREVLDHYIYAIVSDGEMMEGISHEAASLAGHLKLGNLIYLYDDNNITIEGSTSLAFSEDIPRRFKAYGWDVATIDGHDFAQIDRAIEDAQKQTDKPSLIVCKTHIAHGSPNLHDTHDAHGAPLGDDEIKATKEALGFPNKKFYVPKEVKAFCKKRVDQLKTEYKRWQGKFKTFRKNDKTRAELWDACWGKSIPDDLEEKLLEGGFAYPNATRALGGTVIQRAAEQMPALVGGSADLDPSTKTAIKASTSVQAGEYDGRVLHFGVREHGMGSLMNGMALYGCFVPYGGTFLVFADYMRPPIRLAAIMGIQVVFVFTHDSVFVGEDGPTHQPIEQIASLRIIPNLDVLRPADGEEAAYAWGYALRRTDGPCAMILTRQKLTEVRRERKLSRTTFARGGYIVSDNSGKQEPQFTIIASGSEVQLACDAAELLRKKRKHVRVVSMPCLEQFKAQPASYREKVIPRKGKVVGIKAGVSDLWHELADRDSLMIEIDHFGASAPYKELARELGLTPEAVCDTILKDGK